MCFLLSLETKKYNHSSIEKKGKPNNKNPQFSLSSPNSRNTHATRRQVQATTSTPRSDKTLSLPACASSTQPVILELLAQPGHLFLRIVAALQAEEHRDTLQHAAHGFRDLGAVHGLLAQRGRRDVLIVRGRWRM